MPGAHPHCAGQSRATLGGAEVALRPVFKAQSPLETATLFSNVEELRMVGDKGVKAVGNALDNTIHGNGGDNVLVGGGGNDTLYGGDGFDVAEYSGKAGDYSLNTASMKVRM